MIAARSPTRVLICLLLFAASCRPASQSDTPDAYKLRMAVSPASGAALQRVPLPPSIYVASQKSDLSDIRVFDREGKRLPTALLDDRAVTNAQERAATVPTYPIVGPVNALRLSDVSLKVEDGQRARIVGATGTLLASHEPNTIIGALLDTRAIAGSVVAISLSADIPEQQPVTLILESGGDLKTWSPLAQRVMFRPAGANEVLGSDEIRLPSTDLGKRYVRVTWPDTPGLRVRISGAVVRTATSPPSQRVAVSTTPPQLADTHTVLFSLSSATRLDALRMTPAASDGVVPVRLFGRNSPDEPWQSLSAGVIYGAGVRTGTETTNVIGVGGSTFRNYRVVADARTSGFSETPRLELLYRPASLIVQFNASSPFTLATGWANAPDVFLTPKEIVGGEELALARLPQASVAAPPPQVVALPPNAESSAVSPRRALLWTILMLGAAVLLFATVTLFRKAQRPEMLSR